VNIRLVFFFLAFLFSFVSFGTDLETFLKNALMNHPGLEQKKFEVESEQNLVGAFISLEDPMIGWMKEGEMKSWTFSQNLKFPLKYSAIKERQKYKFISMQNSLTLAQWELRSKILSTLFKYDYYAQNIKFVEGQKNNLKEALKLMTSRRANGTVKQQEELRAYLEQTKLEAQYLLAIQNFDEVKAILLSLVGEDLFKNLPSGLPRPQVFSSELSSFDEVLGPEQKITLSNLGSGRAEKSLASLEYFPDFKLSTKQPFKKEEGVKSYAIEMTLPLWFFGKQNPEQMSANAKLHSLEKDLELKKREQKAKIKILVNKISSMTKILEIYESSLLPQAQSSLQSNFSSYKIGNGRFLDVVEAEQLLFEEKMVYLENKLKFIEAILDLETTLGKTVSSFPQG